MVTFATELPIEMRDINDNEDNAAWLLKLSELLIDPALLDSNIALPDSINRDRYIFILFNTYSTDSFLKFIITFCAVFLCMDCTYIFVNINTNFRVDVQ